MLCHKGRFTTTACANNCGPLLTRYVDFSEGGKPEYPDKNPRSTGRDKLQELNSHEIPHELVSVVRGTTRLVVG